MVANLKWSPVCSPNEMVEEDLLVAGVDEEEVVATEVFFPLEEVTGKIKNFMLHILKQRTRQHVQAWGTR